MKNNDIAIEAYFKSIFSKMNAGPTPLTQTFSVRVQSYLPIISLSVGFVLLNTS